MDVIILRQGFTNRCMYGSTYPTKMKMNIAMITIVELSDKTGTTVYNKDLVRDPEQNETV